VQKVRMKVFAKFISNVIEQEMLSILRLRSL